MIQSCDHHDESGSIPDNRSRKRMLEQFRASSNFGEAFLAMARSRFFFTLESSGQSDPTITFDAQRFLVCWQAFMEWKRHEPVGDDLAPAYDPPAEIRVPPLDPED